MKNTNFLAEKIQIELINAASQINATKLLSQGLLQLKLL